MKILSLTIAVIFQMSILFAQTLPPKEAYPLGVKQIHSGHSLTDPLFGQPWPGQYVNLISDLRGVFAGDDIAQATIPGSPMFWRWDNENTLQPTSARHNIDEWELLVITEGIPIPDNGGNPPLITPANEYLSLYVNNAWNNGNNGNGAPTLLWTTWTNLDGSEGPWRQTLDEYEEYWEEMMDYANDNRPSGATPVYLIPGHRMMARIYDDIELDLVPGISDISEFFSDNIHPNSLGDYAVAMIHYACIYNESPVGLPNELMEDPPPGFQFPSPELALYLQTIIWEEVTSYPRTGISETTTSITNTEKLENNLVVIPNPASDYIEINNTKSDIKAPVFIYNQIGKLMYKGNETLINIADFPSGIYFVKSQNQHTKFIKK